MKNKMFKAKHMDTNPNTLKPVTHKVVYFDTLKEAVNHAFKFRGLELTPDTVYYPYDILIYKRVKNKWVYVRTI